MVKIEINNLSKKIKGVEVLKNINLTLIGGKCYGFEGKNGSGKTMLMRAISGLITPSEGKIIINDGILHKDFSFPPSIGVLIENPAFLDEYSAFKNLKILASINNKIGDEEIISILSAVGLDPYDKKKYRKFSLGMKQKLGIANAVMENPDIVLLDEPINAIDQSGIDSVRAIINDLKSKGSIIIVACHDKEELENLSDEIYTLFEGEIVGHRLVVNKGEKE